MSAIPLSPAPRAARNLPGFIFTACAAGWFCTVLLHGIVSLVLLHLGRPLPRPLLTLATMRTASYTGVAGVIFAYVVETIYAGLTIVMLLWPNEWPLYLFCLSGWTKYSRGDFVGSLSAAVFYAVCVLNGFGRGAWHRNCPSRISQQNDVGAVVRVAAVFLLAVHSLLILVEVAWLGLAVTGGLQAEGIAARLSSLPFWREDQHAVLANYVTAVTSLFLNSVSMVFCARLLRYGRVDPHDHITWPFHFWLFFAIGVSRPEMMKFDKARLFAGLFGYSVLFMLAAYVIISMVILWHQFRADTVKKPALPGSVGVEGPAP